MKKDNTPQNQHENSLKLGKSLSTVMDSKLSEVKNESHSKRGIFDMNVFLYRLNFIFKCLGIKHS